MAVLRALIAGNDSSACSSISQALEEMQVRTSIEKDYDLAYEKVLYEKPDFVVFESIDGGLRDALKQSLLKLDDYRLVELTGSTGESTSKSLFIINTPGQIERLADFLRNFLETSNILLHPDFFGKVKPHYLPDLLIRLYGEKRTGILVIESGVKLKIYCQYGVPVSAEGGSFDTAFGRFLLSSGKIKRPVYEKVLRVASEEGQKIGHVLVEMGELTPHELNDLLEDQVKAKILSGFKDTEGTFYFKNQDSFIGDRITFPIRALELILVGIRTYMGENEVRDALKLEPGVSYVFELTGKNTEELDTCGLTGDEFRVLGSFKNPAELSEMAQSCNVDISVVFRLTYFLSLMGLGRFRVQDASAVSKGAVVSSGTSGPQTSEPPRAEISHETAAPQPDIKESPVTVIADLTTEEPPAPVTAEPPAPEPTVPEPDIKEPPDTVIADLTTEEPPAPVTAEPPTPEPTVPEPLEPVIDLIEEIVEEPVPESSPEQPTGFEELFDAESDEESQPGPEPGAPDESPAGGNGSETTPETVAEEPSGVEIPGPPESPPEVSPSLEPETPQSAPSPREDSPGDTLAPRGAADFFADPNTIDAELDLSSLFEEDLFPTGKANAQGEGTQEEIGSSDAILDEDIDLLNELFEFVDDREAQGADVPGTDALAQDQTSPVMGQGMDVGEESIDLLTEEIANELGAEATDALSEMTPFPDTMAASDPEPSGAGDENQATVDKSSLKDEIMSLGEDSEMSGDTTPPSASEPAQQDQPPPATDTPDEMDIPMAEVTGEGDEPAEPPHAEPQEASAEGTPDPSEEQIEILKEVARQHPLIDEKDHYAVLGLEKNAPLKDIKNAYFMLAKKFHPDRNQFLDVVNRKKAEDIFIRISLAYDVLSDAAKRMDYDTEEEVGLNQKQVKNVFEAEVCFKEGESLLKRKMYREALKSFEKSVTLNPEEVEYKGALSWTSFQLAPDKDGLVSNLKMELNKALEQKPNSSQLCYFLGSVLKYGDMYALAEQNFEKAVKIDPTNIDAKRELWLLQRRRPEKEQGKGRGKTDARGKGKTFWSTMFKKS